jgi:hypothetical protein
MKHSLLVIILIPLLISGCSIPSSLPSMPENFNPESIPFLGDLIKKIPFFSSESQGNEIASLNKTDGRPTLKTTNESITDNRTEGQINQTKKPEKISKLTVSPVYAEYDRSSNTWNLVFKLEFLTNVEEEDGRWQINLYSNKLLDKRSLDTITMGSQLKGFSTKYAIKRVKEGTKLKIKMEREIRVLQPSGSTAASYKLQKELDINLGSEIEVLDSKVSCGRVDYLINFSGLIPAKLTVEIKLEKKFSKTFRIGGGESLDVNFDSKLSRNIFKFQNGLAEIHLNLEKFLRIAGSPENGGVILLKSKKILATISFDKPNVMARSEAGKIVLQNSGLPIYIDSVVLVNENSRSIAVGRILCDIIEIEENYKGRILVIGGPNLFWNEIKERYQTKKPEYIVYDGNI